MYIEPPIVRSFVQGESNQTILCYANGKPQPKVQWYYNAQPIPVVDQVYSNFTSNIVQVTSNNETEKLQNVSSRLYLRVRGITLNDAGNYTCKAWNGVNRSAEKTVEVLCKLYAKACITNCCIIISKNISVR